MKIKERVDYKPGTKDECGSPPYAIVPLLNHIEWYRNTMGLTRDKFVIWEPATGMSVERRLIGLVKGFQSVGYKVFCPYRIDFCGISFKKANDASLKDFGHPISMVITNPPFSVKLKRLFVERCNYIFETEAIPYALLMNVTTISEKVNGRSLQNCSLHIPNGRICFDMPEKGWGTEEEPTNSTFSTAWFSKGIGVDNRIYRDNFEMGGHFKAMNEFNLFLDNFNASANWMDEMIRSNTQRKNGLSKGGGG